MYMAPHPIHTIKSFRILSPYTLNIVFGDNTQKTINFFPLLRGEMYGPLKDINCFNNVKLDTEINTIVWPNGADFDPELLYNWELYNKELIERAAKWENA